MAQIELTIYKSGKSLDEAIAEAVLTKLGLKSQMLMQQFTDTYGYANLKDFFKEVLNHPKNAATFKNITKTVNQSGKSTFIFEVSDKLISDVGEFLAVDKRKVSYHLKDAVKQAGSGIIEADRGNLRNQKEALRDLDQGTGQMAKGLYHSLTESVGSREFNKGIDDVRDGLYQFVKGYAKWEIQTPFDDFVMRTGGYVDGAQTAMGLQSIGRSLNLVERQILTDVFGNSLVLDVIRIKQGYSGLYHLGEDRDGQNQRTYIRNYRAMTRGNTIYMKYLNPGSENWKRVLVHESTHVWQAQNGGTDYISEAVYAQVFGDGYKYELGISQGKTWAMLNPEQQAHLIDQAYAAGYFTINKGKWMVIDPLTKKIVGQRADLALFMDGVVPQLRTGQGAT